MSYEAVEWALEIPRLRPPVKLVLVALAERADAKGSNSHPGITELTRRASTSRRRVVEAIRELEAIGAIRVHRSTSVTGKRRNVNRYQLAVGQEISAPRKPSKAPKTQGTTLVPQGNQTGSPGETGTFTEPSMNPHTNSYELARFHRKARDETFGRGSADLEGFTNDQFPDRAMIAAAQNSGADPEQLSDTIANYRWQLAEEAEAGNIKAQRQYRTLWFAVLKGKAPDLEDKL